MGKTSLLAPIRFLFPPLCWHCNSPSYPLCPQCLDLLDPLPLAHPLATFEARGPAWTLMQALKSGKSPHLAQGLAGFMAFQYLKYNLPLPDLIVPVPQTVFRFFQVGYNPAFLLAKSLGKILDRPVFQLLKRKKQLYRQMKLGREHRFQLSSHHFTMKTSPSIATKTILLIDDVLGTGTTLRCCAKKLYEGFPLKIIKMACILQDLHAQVLAT